MTKQNQSLPTSFLIVTAKFIWKNLGQLMMSNLAPCNDKGSYNRTASQFRHQINQEKDNIYTPQKDRYSLYVGISCPWAHRTLMVRNLKGLEDVIDVNIVIPEVNKGGWIMKNTSENCQTLRQLYQLSKPNYKGRCTVPVLWDKKTKTIVNNESSEIIILLNNEFNNFAKNANFNLYPDDLKSQIQEWNNKIYHYINNGVYRCGFAQTQSAYEEACQGLFTVLDEIEAHFVNNRYLCGDRLTLADIRLFTTLIRFDTVYYSLFKCSLKMIKNFNNLSRYLEDINNLSGIKNTYDLKVIKQDYYGNLFPLNPSGIIPL
ncbi:glutathione S-transferase C-terminal domain-containing protein [Geminocystis sp. GBBB08]|uniref:glutathione S-transferase family protein n=1 Tax=Geminocystis sp. GBBB08 TaxID=2604140 RepID=UPI0027E38EBE|nr:glutathione S-transferase C-terminal domain-containing protein [Geminocystis sp. GBBB08]MBL1208917.1 glutathione S-transferase family protein [Geminocystis sp. GBBB08]